MYVQGLADALVELRDASMSLGDYPSEDEVGSLMEKYQLLFLGDSFSTIYSVDLHFSLSSRFNMDIPLSELNELLPDVCLLLDMKCIPVSEMNKHSVNNGLEPCYKIVLH